jgi:cholesterol oxidase
MLAGGTSVSETFETEEFMDNFDYDVIIIGSEFGGSVAALRAAEKGYRLGVMEAGRRWKDEDIPKTQ